MTPNKAGRGRPKGTGLNDAAQLRAIANLMAADPDLKPTTAIKTLGITDPSIIRRLRDKYSAVESQLIAEIAPRLPFDDAAAHLTAAVPAAPVAMAVAAQSLAAMHAANGNAAGHAGGQHRTYSARAVPLAAERLQRRIEPARACLPVAETIAPVISTDPAVAAEPLSSRPQRPRHFPLPSETPLGDWIGMGLSLYALSVEAQVAVAASMFQWPPFAAILNSQVAFTHVAVAMTRPVTGSSQPG